MNETEFKGRVVLITGAAQGIGAAVAQVFSQQGARVAAVDVQKEAIESAALRLTSQGGDVTAFPLDVTNNEAVRQTVADIEQRSAPSTSCPCGRCVANGTDHHLLGRRLGGNTCRQS